jgi:NAD(P)-dependent dehydrogenase (short-subunit alcohol dehydrogenase family)
VDYELNGQCALVTGAARGIGQNIAACLAAHGATVVVCDIDREGGERAASRIRDEGGHAHFVCHDISDPQDRQSLIQKVRKIAGRLDVLVNNAKSGRAVSFVEETEASWLQTMNVTLQGAFFLARQAAEAMRENGGGSIVNIGSLAGYLATHESPSYHAAKAALMHLTRYLAVAMAEMRVRVNCVCPGFIVQDEHHSRFSAAGNEEYRRLAQHIHPLGRVGSSDDVAHAVAFLASQKASFVNGHVLVLDGGSSVLEQFCLLRGFSRGASALRKT